jgi:isochorismate hydrolase
MSGIPPISPYPLPAPESLPANVARWTLRPERAALLLHDMQNYFVHALVEPLRQDLVYNVAVLRKRCVAVGVPVLYTAQPGRMSMRECGLLRDFWGPGMRTDPADRAVVPEVAPEEHDRVFTKWRYSAFARSGLLRHLRSSGRDQIILAGVYGHIGVLATAIDAFTRDIQPFLVADAIGDFSEADHRLTLAYVARRCGMVIPVAEVFR